MKLKFISNGIYNGIIEFHEGQVYEIDDSLGAATRWLKRGVAVVHHEEPVKEVLPEVVEVLDLEVQVEEQVEQTEQADVPKKRKTK